MRVALLLIPLFALSGCLTDVLPGATDDGAAVERLAFLTEGMGLAPEGGKDAAVRTGAFFSNWAAGDDYATWVGEAYPEDMLVEDVRIDLVIRATGPVVGTNFPDIMVYAGGGESWMGFGSTSEYSHLAPGGVTYLKLDLTVPEGGLWVPAGERFGFKVVPVMLQNEQTDIEVLVGPDGSRARWIERPLGEAPRPLKNGSERGELAGSAYAGAAAPESTSRATVVEVPEGARAFLAWMNTTSADGIPDIDLALFDPDGNQVAFSGTPTPREALKLAAVNLVGPGDYRLVVTSYGSARAAYQLDWSVG